MNVFGNWARVRRAGQLKQDRRELAKLDKSPLLSNEEEKKAKKLAGRIGRNEERNKIASEKSLKPQIDNSTHENNLSYTSSKTITKKQGIVEAEVNIAAKNQKSVKSKEPTKTKKK